MDVAEIGNEVVLMREEDEDVKRNRLQGFKTADDNLVVVVKITVLIAADIYDANLKLRFLKLLYFGDFLKLGI